MDSALGAGGKTVLTNSATVSITTGSTKFFIRRTVDNYTAVTWNGGTIWAGYSCTWNNKANSLFDIVGDLTWFNAYAGNPVFVNVNGLLGLQASSARYKRDIQDIRERSQGLYRLRPVTFRYKQDAQGQRQYGLIAEEVAKVYPELVVRGAKGEVESVQYQELIPMLLNEVQHQQQALTTQARQVAELQAQNESLRAAHAQELAELKAQNERLQAALAQQTAAVAARLERLEQGAVRAASFSR